MGIEQEKVRNMQSEQTTRSERWKVRFDAKNYGEEKRKFIEEALKRSRQTYDTCDEYRRLSKGNPEADEISTRFVKYELARFLLGGFGFEFYEDEKMNIIGIKYDNRFNMMKLKGDGDRIFVSIPYRIKRSGRDMRASFEICDNYIECEIERDYKKVSKNSI